MSCSVVQAVNMLLMFLNLAILGRVLLSWVDPTPYPNTGLKRALWALTEPLLGPIRRALPPAGMLDMSALVALIGLLVVGEIVSILFPYC